MDHTEPIVALRDVTKTYTTGAVDVTALRDTTLSVMPGEFVALMGPSGSGKSTLMNIVGLLDRPTSGQYLFEGLDVTRRSDGELARMRRVRIGFIFQSFNLFPRADALKNVSMPLVYSGVPARQRRRRALEMLRQVGLEERARHRPHELSGGQQQRVAIARALVNRPAVILGDEPTGNLDSATGESVLALLQELNDMGVTIVMVTHDERVARHAGRIVRLLDGQVIEDTRPTESLRASVPVSTPVSTGEARA